MQQSAFAYAQPYDANKAPYWNGSMFLNADTVGGPAAATGMAAQQPLLPPPHLQPSANGMVHPDTPPAVNNNNAEAFNQTWQAAAVGAGAGTSEGTDNYAVKAEQQDEETSYTPKGKKKQQQQRQKPAKTKKGGSSGGRRDNLDKAAKQEQRMMKNRESAARSRQRRQQHTTDLEQANAKLRKEVAGLRQQLLQLQHQLNESEWQLQLAKMPANMPRASLTVSHGNNTTGNQHQHNGSNNQRSDTRGGGAALQGISHLPPAPSLSLSLPAASSLMMPPPLLPTGQELAGGVAQMQDGLAVLVGEGFDFQLAYHASRRGSSYA